MQAACMVWLSKPGGRWAVFPGSFSGCLRSSVVLPLTRAPAANVASSIGSGAVLLNAFTAGTSRMAAGGLGPT